MRKKRSFKVNRCYHLISRIAHRAFFFDEGEKDRFVNLIRRVEQFCGVRVLGYAVMSNHFHVYVYLEDEHPVGEEELYAKICRLYCKDTLAAITDKWERLKELAAQADVSIRNAGLTEFDDYKRSFVARMFNITSFMMTLKEHYTLPVKLERGDSRVAMSVLAALKDGAKKPAQLRISFEPDPLKERPLLRSNLLVATNL